MRVAAIILNWNGWRDTCAAIASLRRQSRKPDWIVVVDNASTDDSWLRLSEETGVVLLQSGANLGFAGGNNVGVRWARAHGADSVWLLNNDAVADVGALDALVRLETRRPEVGLIGTRIYEMSNPAMLQCWGGGWINLWTGRAREFNRVVGESDLDYVSGCSLYMTKRGLAEGGLLDEGFFMYFEDAELSLRYRRLGLALAVADEAFVRHKGGASAKPGRLQSSWRTQSLLRVLRVHAPQYAVSLAVSTALRAASMLAHGDLGQLRALREDVHRFAQRPDWREPTSESQ